MNDTITSGLQPYRLGEKLRTLRLQKSMGLVQLSKHTSLSPAMLSKLERGRIVPTLPTLLRIAMVFGVGLDHFFADKRKPVIALVRQQDRIQLPSADEGTGGAYTYESLDFKANDRKLNAYLADFQPAEEGKARPHHHPGVEFLFVLEGSLSLSFGQEEYVLEKGDAIYFDSNHRHAYGRHGKKSCKAIVVTTR